MGISFITFIKVVGCILKHTEHTTFENKISDKSLLTYDLLV